MEKKSNKNVIKICVYFFVIICIVFVVARYLINPEFRNTVDSKIFNKQIEENTSSVIEINSDEAHHVCTFDKYLAVFSKKALSLYNNYGNVISKIDVDITTPYIATSEKNCVIAEKGGNKVYSISETGVKWEKDIDGEIYRVSVNKNGYVSVISRNAIYKSVIVIYDNQGKELFKTYLSTSYALCSEISENNQYLAIGQIDYSGTIIKSVIKLISIDLAKANSQNSILYTYESETSKVLNNLKFNDKNEVICMFDTYIQKITELSDEKLYDIKDNDIFIDISLGNDIVIIEKETTGLFAYKYQMNIKSTIGKSDNLYFLENDMPKQLKINKNLICMKLINEVRIINQRGWLLKSYYTNNEIKNIVVGDNIIGVVYNNKIEIINL